MKKLKFCMITTFYPPYNFGGDGIFIHRLVNALAADGHLVHVVHDGDAYRLLAPDWPKSSVQNHPNVTVHTLRRGGYPPLELLISHQIGWPMGTHRRIKAILEENDFDVVHFHNVSLMGGPQVLRYGKGIKLCTMHDYWFVCPMHVLWRFDREACTKRTCLSCTIAGHRPPQLWRYTGSIGRAVRHVDAFIAPSDFSCQMLARNGFPAPVREIPYFLPAIENQEGLAPSDGLIHPRSYFLFVGRLEKIKGVQVLLDVFRHYKAADLLIAGTGVYEETLREMARGLSQVQFLGRLEYGRLKEYYKKAVAVLVPSLCFETFGFIVLEAFSMRVPVIVNEMGAPPGIVRSAGGGFVYRTTQELLEAMEKLRNQPELARQLGERGHQYYVQNYTEVEHLKKYYDLIEEIQVRRLRGGT